MFELSAIGTSYSHDSSFHVYRPNGSGNYLFLCFYNPMRVVFNGDEAITSGDCCILYSPEYPQDYRGYGEYFKNDWLHFTEGKNESFIKKINIPLNTIIYTDRLFELSSYIKSIEAEQIEMNDMFGIMTDLKIKELLCTAARQYNSKTSAGINHELCEKLRLLRKKIYSDYTAEWYIDEMSKSLNISSSYFQYVYKKLFGISPIKDLISVRMENAKIYLQSGNYTVVSISSMVGCTNEYHFIRQFKQYTGITPKKYSGKY